MSRYVGLHLALNRDRYRFVLHAFDICPRNAVKTRATGLGPPHIGGSRAHAAAAQTGGPDERTTVRCHGGPRKSLRCGGYEATDYSGAPARDLGGGNSEDSPTPE